MEIKKANTIDEIYGAVLARALTIEEMDQFYCETDAVRSKTSAKFQLKTIIRQNAIAGNNAHLLFVGYRGCGKSTELNHLQKELQNEYAIINYSVMEELDPQSIQYIELFIVTMEKLFRFAIDNQLDIDTSFLEKIVSWTQTKEINEIKDKHFSLEAEAGIETKLGIPYLQQFFLKLKGAAKASKSFKETIKRTLEPRLSELIKHCNELISEVRIKMMGLGYKDLVIFIEDLDKIPLDVAKILFFNYANQLTQLRATVIYTFPVSLYYNTKFGAIRNYFTEIIELPMVKIRQKDGNPYQEGIGVLKNIVTTRINQSLFANEAVLLKFIMITGGVIRDLFNIINRAAIAALYEERGSINEDHYMTAYYSLKREYNNTIADYKDEEGNIFKASSFYEAMAILAKDLEKKTDNSDIMLLLRQNLCVLSYNGEGWCDVHPILKDELRERHYID